MSSEAIAISDTDKQPSRLTREAIVAAGIDIADADGIGALSMRRIADRLGAGAMSLYRHIADKDALLLAMSNEIDRRFPYPMDTDPPWRERVRIAVDLDWQIYRKHPWVVLAYASPRHSMGEQSLRCLNWMVEGFLQLDVTVEVATEMALTVWIAIQGAALAQVSEELLQTRSDTDETSGLADFLHGASPFILPPYLAELAGSDALTDLTDPRTRLDRTIDYLCAGFQVRAGE